MNRLIDVTVVLWVHLVALVVTMFGAILILTAVDQIPSGGSRLFKILAGLGGLAMIESARYVEHRFLLRFREDRCDIS